MRGSGGFLAERLKEPLSLRIIPAIKGRQCVLDSFSNVLPSVLRKKTLSGCIILVNEGCRRLPERINRGRVERGTATEPPPHGLCRSSRPGSFSPPQQKAQRAAQLPPSLAFVLGAGSEGACPDAASAAAGGGFVSDPCGLATDDPRVNLALSARFPGRERSSLNSTRRPSVECLRRCFVNSQLRA